MKKLLITSLIPFFLASCGGNSVVESGAQGHIANAPTDETGQCTGYVWAERAGGDCDGYSQSFNEWCQNENKDVKSFVSTFNGILVEYIADQYLNGSKPSDPVVQELERLGMIGVKIEGNDIVMSHFLLLVDDEIGINEFEGWIKGTEQKLRAIQEGEGLSEANKCIYSFISDNFNSVILSGPEDLEAIIPTGKTN